ncbi:hypothetical protein F4803DRAFT_276716 [Xylaria telfairii]|nr:hypothetical protein F4803DRAFT_276716 [Xylaria telfairii]
MNSRRHSMWSIDSLVEQDLGSYHGFDSGPYAADTHSNMGQAPDMNPRHGQPWQVRRAAYEPVSGQTPPPALGYKSESFASSPKGLRSRKGTFMRARRAWYYGWVAESVGCCLAAISLIAIIITLRLHEDKPLPRWPLSISINALIAVFGVLLKAGLTVPLSEGISQLKWIWFERQERNLLDLDEFDAASRGPWGSFLLLFTVYGEPIMRPSRLWLYPWSLVKFLFRWNADHTSGYFAKFAALLTVLTIAIDPFAQQIVLYVDCSRASFNEHSLVARTNNYYAQGGHIGAGETDIDAPMAVAINTGMVNPPEHIQSLIATDCKSGNCTFGDFASIGVCRSCEDITSELRDITGPDGIQNISLPGESEDKYGFPSIYLQYQYVFQTRAKIPIGSHLLDLRIASRPGYNAIDAAPSAFHCSLMPCVRTYSSSISKNNLDEVVLSSTPMGQNLNIGESDQDNHERAIFRLVTSHTLRNGSEVDCVPSDKDGTGLTKVAQANVDAAPSDIIGNGVANATAWYPEDCVWSFGQGSRYAILTTLMSELDGLDMQLTGGVTVGPIAAKNMWKNGTIDLGHISDYMQKLADVMTATMRNNGRGGRDDYARGQVLVNETCIKVRWAWLAYPTALVGLTILFLVIVMVQGPLGSSSRTWKSSILAPLFISMDETVYDTNHYDMSKYEMKELAEQIRTQLIRDPVGKAKFL